MAKYWTLAIEDEIGHGAYGHVFAAQDSAAQPVAVKRVRVSESGVPCLLEAAIMASARHPAINRARAVYCDDKYLYIVQDRARTDLARQCRRSPPALPQLQQWCAALAAGVYHLHELPVIHGDIKAANVLLFADGSVRLGDFTLAVRKWPGCYRFFSHKICTSTHRPPEVWRSLPWDESADIWALGCTFYEMAFGRLLFPSQQRPNATARHLRAFATWATTTDQALPGRTASTESRPPCPQDDAPEFAAPAIHPAFGSPEYSGFRDLVVSMLRIDPRQRPTIGAVLRHPFLAGIGVGACCWCIPIARNPPQRLPLTDAAYRACQGLPPRLAPAVCAIMAELYNCSAALVSLDAVDADLLLAGCFWIATKLAIRRPLQLPHFPLAKIRQTEKAICTYLSYNILFPVLNT